MRYSFPMGKKAQKQIEVPANIEGFDVAEAFVEDLLASARVHGEILQETLLLFETLFGAVVAQEIEPTPTIAVTVENSLGSFNLKIGYEGKRFELPEDEELMPELKLLEGFADKISYSYHSGYNIIRISVQKTPDAFFVSCGIGILIAIVVWATISRFIGPEAQAALCKDYIFPFENLIANAVLMVGAPVTFFSLLKNASDLFIVSERASNSRRLLGKTLSTSALAIAVAMSLTLLLATLFPALRGMYEGFGGGTFERSFAEIVVSMAPASIFEPFEAISPIPLIVVALLVTYALCSAGKYFEALKTAIDACYGLFSGMLSAVMLTLPVACCLGVLDVLLNTGLWSLGRIVLIIFVGATSVHLLLGTYAYRLFVRGIPVLEFSHRLADLFKENRAIGSIIDAVPYNIRYLARKLGMDRRHLQASLPILAQVNLDGNCYILTLIAMWFIFLTDIKVAWLNIVVICALILLLSFGAPNQPGSILIGTLIIVTYLNSFDLLAIAFILEAFLGSVQNMINVISCMVTVAEEEGVKFPEQG